MFYYGEEIKAHTRQEEDTGSMEMGKEHSDRAMLPTYQKEEQQPLDQRIWALFLPLSETKKEQIIRWLALALTAQSTPASSPAWQIEAAPPAAGHTASWPAVLPRTQKEHPAPTNTPPAPHNGPPAK